jgi:hypothetical protein
LRSATVEAVAVARPRHRGDPVFVDRTGRRRRIAVVAGGIAGLALVLAALAMFVGFTGVGAGYLPGLPGAGGAPAATGPAPAGQPLAAHPSGRTPRSVPPGNVPAGALGPSGTPSPSASTHRTVPTQTPSHPGKKK